MASKDTDTDNLRQNGEIVRDALCQLQEPANMKTIISHIAETLNLNENDIKNPVRDVLKTGYAYGFLKKDGLKYFIEPSDKRRRGGRKSGKKSRSKSRSRSRGKKSRSRSRSRSRRGRK